MINVYVLLIIFSLFFILVGIYNSLVFAPKKIKIFSIVLCILFALRYLTLILFILVKNIVFLYIFKPIFFINYLTIPMAALTAIYIIMRNEKIKFSNIFLIFLVALVLYIILLLRISSNIEFSEYIGYRMYLLYYDYINLCIVLINVAFIVLATKLLYKRNLDRLGIYMIIISSLCSIIEVIIAISFKEIYQPNLFGDFLWIITFVYALKRLKSRN